MTASLPPPSQRGRGGHKPALPWQKGNPRYAIIFLVALLLIVTLYVVNKRQVDIEKRDEVGKDRLCEVRAQTGADPVDCEEDT
jgi:hypothetical protein